MNSDFERNLIMKKLLGLVFLFLSLSGVIYADYPDYLYDNLSYRIIYAHMGGASYLDTTSVVLKKIDHDGIIFAQNQIGVEFNRDITEIKEVRAPHTVWFYKPWNPQKMGMTTINIDGHEMILPPYVGSDVAYVSYDNGNNWRPFYISNTYGYNMSTRMAFLLGYQTATGQSY